jgi:fatty acid desaturase
MIRRNLTDRIAIYRLSGILIAVVVVRGIVVRITDYQSLPLTGWAALLWLGFLLLMFNLVRDGVHEYRARRQVKQMIEGKIQEKA